MRRVLGITAVVGAVLLVAACGRDDIAGQKPETETTTVTAAASPTVESPEQAANRLCGSAVDSPCIITGTPVRGNLELAGKRVVKLINVQVGGSVRVDGATLLTIVDSTIAGGLTIGAAGTTVIRSTTVDGALEISRGRNLTLENSTVGGKLSCDVRRVTGSENMVSGLVGGACAAIS